MTRYLVYSLERQGFEVGEHAGDVGPEHAQLLLPLVGAACRDAVLLLLPALPPMPAVRAPALPGPGPLLHDAPGVRQAGALPEEALVLPEADLPPQGGEGHPEAGGQLGAAPGVLLLEPADTVSALMVVVNYTTA